MNDQEKLDRLLAQSTHLTWANVPAKDKERMAVLRRKIHCDRAGVEVPPGHPVPDAFYRQIRNLHTKLRKEMKANRPGARKEEG